MPVRPPRDVGFGGFLLGLGETVLGSSDPQRTMRELLDGAELR